MLTAIDKHGNKHTNIKEVLKCWKEHFQEHSNKTFLQQKSVIGDISDNNHSNQPIENITKDEIQRSIGTMKNR